MEEDFLAGDMTDICGDLFDHIEDFLEFPNDEDLIAGVDHCPPPPPPPPPQQHHDHMLPLSASFSSQMMMVPTPVAPAPHPLLHDVTFLGGDSSITATAPEHDDHDMAQLEWLSNFFDDSSCDPFSQDLPKDNMKMNVDTRMNSISDNSGFNGIIKSGMEDALFRTSSPVSVLEQHNNLGGLSNSGSATATATTTTTTTTTSSSSSSSCSGAGSSSNEKLRAPPHSPPEPMVSSIPARARTKRPRALASSRPLISMSFVPPPSSEAEAESFGESESPPSMDAATMPMMMQKNKKQKTTKKKCSPEVAAEDGGEEADGQDAPPPSQVRKCMHCEIQKTPQWRAGPMGPKTLCNACGVRYKSGRLFPEYRPAASPTFVPTLHSNSHKKVVEMRIKASHKTSTTAEKESPALKNCDLIEYIRRRG